MSSFFQEYGSEMISKVLNIFIFHSFALLLGRYRCARWRLVNTFAQYCHYLTSALQTVPSFFISFDDSNFWCRQNTRYYRAIHLFPSTYFKKHVYRNENVDEIRNDFKKY